MHYLVKWFKHNVIILALSTLVASFAALYSVKLFLLLLVLMIWMLHKKFPVQLLFLVVMWSFVSFLYFEQRLLDNNDPPQIPGTFTWTERYKINGDEVRGFMKSDSGDRIYVVYEIKTEGVKKQLLEKSLVGLTFQVTSAEWVDVTSEPKVHRYSFSMETYLKGQNAKGTLEISTWQLVSREASFSNLLARYRFWLNQHIERTFPESLVAEAQALIFGDQQHVDEDLNRAYQILGITHLFAISGLHVALLSVFLYEVLIRCKVRIQLAQLIIIVALPIYACLAGGAPSVWRAVLLVEILYAVRMLKGRFGVDDALALAFIASLLWQPAFLLQIGFQLSYIACASLIYGQKFMFKCNYWWQQGFVMTLLCQLLAYPILLYHFYELSLSSFIANIVFVPLFSFIVLPINVVLLVITLFSEQLAKPFFALYEPLRQLVTDIIIQMQQVPHQLWIPGKPSLMLLGILLMTVIAGFVLWEQGRKWLAVVVIFVPTLLFSNKHLLQDELQVSFVDVGQGDCIVIELPRRKAVYVVDSGGLLRFGEKDWRSKSGQYEVGKQVVLPYLKGKGISQIDTFIFSHADADHVEGAEEVMQELAIREIHISPNSISEVAMQDIVLEASKRGVAFHEKMAGDVWTVGDVHFSYIWPIDTHYEGNNDSLVLQLQYGKFEALFTGDLEEEGERALVRNGVLQKQTILKAGHHGSKTSSSEAFIDATSPQLTIFTAGDNNRYNHPHPEVVQRFEERSLHTLSTKENNTIEVSTDGRDMMIIHD